MLWNDYRTTCIDDKTKNVSRSTFLKIVNAITQQDEVTLCAIDYVSVLLINEPIEVLQEIINVCVNTQKERERFSNYIGFAKNFVKY